MVGSSALITIVVTLERQIGECAAGPLALGGGGKLIGSEFDSFGKFENPPGFSYLEVAQISELSLEFEMGEVSAHNPRN